MAETSSTDGDEYRLETRAYRIAVSLFGGLFFVFGLVAVGEGVVGIGSSLTLVGFILLSAGLVRTVHKSISGGFAPEDQPAAVVLTAAKLSGVDTERALPRTATKVSEE